MRTGYKVSIVCVCRCAQLLRQHALIPLAVPAGLGPTVHCCMLALLYCTALETSHSLMLSPRLMRDLWPTCEQVHTVKGMYGLHIGYLLYNLMLHQTATHSSAPLPPGCHMSTKCISPSVCCAPGGRALQVLQKKLRRLNDDLKREVATELDGVAAQVHVHTHTHHITRRPATCVLESMHPSVQEGVHQHATQLHS